MDILLIDPPHSILKGQSIDRGYGLGLTSLAAYLRANGIETGILAGDLLMGPPSSNILASFIPKWLRTNVKSLAAGQRRLETIVGDKDHIIWKNLADSIRQAAPLAVAMPYYTPLKYVVEIVAGIVRQIDPRIKIIAGAFHPTFCPDEVMRNPDIDFVIRGEGEIPLLALIKEIKKDKPEWKNVPGLTYRDAGGQVRHNAVPDLITDLDELPFPARDAVLNCDYDTYRHHSIATSRGCPYTCAFCADRRLWGGKVRRRSVGKVIEELKSLKDTYKVRYVEIVDGTFTYDRKYLETFCHALIDQELNIKWGCTARYDNLDEGILKLMKQANCWGLYLGLESGSNRVLKSIDKKETIERDIEVSKLIYDSGILSATSILLGTPDETKEDIEATLKIMKHFKTDFFDINSYVPLPGTPLYDAMGKEERENIDWRKVGMKSFESYFSRQMTREELNAYREEAYEISNKVRRKNILRLAVRRVVG